MPEKRSSEGSKEPTKQKPSGGGGGASSTGQKRGRPPGIKEGKAIAKPPKPAVKSPVPKGQKVSGQKKAKEAGQTQATSTKSFGTASSFRHRRDSRTRFLGVPYHGNCLHVTKSQAFLQQTSRSEGSSCCGGQNQFSRSTPVAYIRCDTAGADESQSKAPQEGTRGPRTRNQ